MAVLARQEGPPGADAGSNTTKIIIILVVVIVCMSCAIVAAIWYLRRQTHHRNGVKSSWRISLRSIASSFWSTSFWSTPDVRSSAHGMRSTATAVGVDRHTSIRSVVTLPAYSAVPRDGEGTIGREGDRAGMDVVVEFPETGEEEEDRREQEMEALYQIRVARRAENSERESRRERRREARRAGDQAALRAIRQESQRARDARQSDGSAALISSHESRPRSRRISSVSYANLGVARHDGTRVRASSGASELPLLDSAGEIDLSDPIRPWLSRGSSRHRRGGSSMSNLSMTSYGSEDESAWSDGGSSMETVSLQPQRSRAHSAARSTDAAQSLLPQSISRATSSDGPLHSSHGVVSTAHSSIEPPAPSYEEHAPPPYSGETTLQPPAVTATQDGTGSASAGSTFTALPTIERLPSIRITVD